VTSNVVSFPRELARGSATPGWQSLGDAAGSVLSCVAFRSGVASNVSPILREEGGEWPKTVAFAVPAEQRSGVTPATLSEPASALSRGHRKVVR
jgi:hypothetical protein